MFSFRRSSLKTRVLCSLIPFVISALGSSMFLYKNASSKDDTLSRAIAIVDTVSAQELAMVSMSEALRGYILEPKNSWEFTRKKEMDAIYAAMAEKLEKLAGSNKEISVLNAAMAELDANELDKAENELGVMINEDRDKVLSYFANTYSPIRAKQATNFAKLKSLSLAYSNLIIRESEDQKKLKYIYISLLILLGAVVGFVSSYLVITKANKDASTIFTSIYKLSDEFKATANILSDKSKDLSDSTTMGASAIQQTASSMHEVTAMVEKNTDNANRTTELSRLTKNASYKGQASIKDVLISMDDINLAQTNIINKVDEGNSKIAEIVGLIMAIDDKTKVINDIVFQTKLLSFNASVEAARAGEQGKGFAVVAEEVGNLAQMSGKAAQEITQMLQDSIGRVKTIIDETKSSVDKIVQLGKEKISKGSTVAKECESYFGDVVLKIEEMDKTIAEISVASNEQYKGVTEINTAILSLDASIQKNNISAVETFESSKILNHKSVDLRAEVDSMVTMIRGEGA